MNDKSNSGLPSEPSPRSVGAEKLWISLRRLTPARIGLKRCGASLATAPLLDFQLAHARARDAVHEPLNIRRLTSDLAALALPVVDLISEAENHQHYLMRPDLGRRLAPAAQAALARHAGAYDVAFVIADGLSARAVQLHAQPTLAGVLPDLRAERWRIAPLVVVRHGRVAVGDVIATILGAACVVVLIGERPGLSAPDSMGAYLTWQPQPQTNDAQRNCISNIRPEGIGYPEAAFKLAHLLRAMRAQQRSGVQLKDDSDQLLVQQG
jgi:ethanolamine ammonia-lyase small subunit